jgi:hypothetical protein
MGSPYGLAGEGAEEEVCGYNSDYHCGVKGRHKGEGGLVKQFFGLIAVSVCAVVLLAGTGNGEDTMAARTGAAQKTAEGFMQELVSALKKEMAVGGPAGAVSVCSDLAPTIAGRISRETGWRVTRVGTRVRNPLLGMPDAWEQKVLLDFEKRAARGEDVDKMGYSEVVNEPSGKFFRYMKAVALKAQCLACHGSEEQIAPQVRTILKERYPHDRAINYKVGDLRGAISIKEPL